MTKISAKRQKLTKSADFRIQSGAKVYKFCRSRKMQKNDYLLAKFGVDTAENEPLRARLRARLNIGLLDHAGNPGLLPHRRAVLPVLLRSGLK